MVTGPDLAEWMALDYDADNARFDTCVDVAESFISARVGGLTYYKTCQEAILRYAAICYKAKENPSGFIEFQGETVRSTMKEIYALIAPYRKVVFA